LDFGFLLGEWSGYSLLVLGLLRASASLWAIRFYPYPDGRIKNGKLKIKNRKIIKIEVRKEERVVRKK
jgi:hypothetical protein